MTRETSKATADEFKRLSSQWPGSRTFWSVHMFISVYFALSV